MHSTKAPTDHALLAATLIALIGPALEAADADNLAAGKALYNGEGSCAVCHMPDGKGQPGSVPPLAGSDWLKGGSERSIAIALRGLAGPVKVNGKRYYSAMPPQLLFDDEKLAHILTYVNQSWGNQEAAVTPAQVARARATLPEDVYSPNSILKAFPFPSPLQKRNGTFKLDFDDMIKDVTTPVVYRTFMPGASPAAFAVALPGNQFYCWDAGECRLRYVWTKGGFIRGNKVHWSTNGKPVAEFYGAPYYRARSSLLKPEDYQHLGETNRQTPFYDTSEASDFPFHIEGVDARPKFKGYRLLNGFPEFRYALGKHLIRESIRTTPDNLGVVRSFAVEPPTPITLRLTPTDLAKISASAGRIARNGALTLTAKQSREFSVTIIEKNPAPRPAASEFE